MRALLAFVLICTGLPAGAQQITAATYTAPTDRYDHGVLGDAIEWGALQLTLADGRRVTHQLPQTRVFEDIAPRLADLDGDGAPEVIVIKTEITTGASLAVYDASGKRAATPHIGRNNRWLAPLGAADLDGDGHIELAYIDRPHLARTLRIWRYQNGTLLPVAELSGLTNHRIGEDFISGGIRDCGQGPEIITANATWSRLMASRLDQGRLSASDIGLYRNRDSFAAALQCR